MEHRSFDGLSFVDSGGILRIIYGCNLKKRRELAHTLTQLHDRLAATKIHTLAELYDHDCEFSAIADHCLSLCRIDPAWLTIDMLNEFLLPHRKNDEPCRPILEQINFPALEPQREGGTYPEAVAALWSHTQDLEQALRLAGYEKDVPWDELSEIMQARNAQSPESQQEEEMEAIARDLEQQLHPGAVGSEMAIASPQQADRLMEAISRG